MRRFFSDVVGYSRLAGADEDRILARLKALRSDLIDPTIAVHNGRVVKRTGDGSLIDFRSVVDAVRCAIEVRNWQGARASLPSALKIGFGATLTRRLNESRFAPGMRWPNSGEKVTFEAIPAGFARSKFAKACSLCLEVAGMAGDEALQLSQHPVEMVTHRYTGGTWLPSGYCSMD